MGKNIIILGATDTHPERLAKLPKFLSVFCKVAEHVTLLSSVCPDEFIGQVEWIKVESCAVTSHSSLNRIYNFFAIQIRLTRCLFLYGRSDQRLVALRRYILPGLVARLLGMKPIRYHAGPSFRASSSGINNRIAEFIVNRAYSKIAVPSHGCIEQFGLEKYKEKIVFGPFPVESLFFQKNRGDVKRKFTLGYFGNLTFGNEGVRAVDSLIEGFRKLRNHDSRLTLVLGGVGPVSKCLSEDSAEGIMMTGWLSHEQVCNWLDRIKLLVLPSIDEGLATILLQAMARKTPVLATPVGGSLDLIKDEETGFVIGNTHPDCISANIQRALSHPDLKQIAENGRNLVEQQYSFSSVVKRWRQILDVKHGKD
ncbi:MAG: glycosyltransferase family 4 protein [Thermotogota bacterium]|nr:glycosyltransferase family 4 protein [Thermotogota bacterium]